MLKSRKDVKKMKNYLIVYSNPCDNSFSYRIKERAKEFLKSEGHRVEVRDLYKMEFNPLLTDIEIRDFSRGVYSTDIQQEQAFIKWADVIIFVFPIWWGIPAMLKGYIDKVFSYGFAYKTTPQGMKGLLQGKKVYRFSPMRTLNETYDHSGYKASLINIIDKGIFEYAGMKVIDSKLFGGIPREDEKIAEEYLHQVEVALKKSFH